MSAAKKPPTARATRHADRAYFDFNYVEVEAHPPSAAQAAMLNVQPEALMGLFQRLEAADDMLASDPRNPRAAVSAALAALVQFGRGNLHGAEGRFSRAVELLSGDLNTMPAPMGGEIFPSMRGWPGRRRFRRAQACSAYALERLRSGDDDQGAPSVHEAAGAVAAVLQAHGVTRTDPVSAIIAWGKGTMAQPAKDELARLRSNPPAIDADADRVQQRLAVLKWLAGELEEAGYDCL